MSYLREALRKKERELTEIIVQTNKSLRDSPSGQLRISNNGGTARYYYRTQETDGLFHNGKYIRKEEKRLAYLLAQRDYERDLIKTAKRQLDSIQMLLKNYDTDELQKVYESISTCRKELVIPKVVSDERFAEQWEQVTYQGKPFGDGSPEIYTEKGERVRSKSEKIIADMLYRKQIKYRYESPLTVRGMGTVYPDFTILNVKKRQEIYWEHLGMMDHSEYCERALYKISCYIKNGICLGDRLLISYETLKRPLETAVIEQMITVNFT